ncbi:MAG: ABC transporter permease subunit [Acidobacteriota bacterium]|jgi:NitT/TauT family transport system permease protein|nr:ABC transporter permease subunit [Acidobacteriota bacterium]
MLERSLKNRFLTWPNLLLVILLGIQFLPDRVEKDPQSLYVVAVALAAGILGAVAAVRIEKPSLYQLFCDIMTVIYAVLIAWTLFTAKGDVLREALFPGPGRVFQQIMLDWDKILVNIASSLGIIVQGFALGGVTAIPLGLFLGWSLRFSSAAIYISKFLGAIPPVVYIPYGIALLPTFRSVSVFVIFLATFWPVLAGTMSGALGVDGNIIDSAKVMNLGRWRMLRRIILPASLPQIFLGCNQGLSVSFILLTSAEMIGARNGMGYYIKNYSDLGNYTRALAGVIVIGVVITVFVYFINRLQRHLLRWKR